MRTSYHVHISKAALVVDVVREWPVTWLTGGDGKPFGSLLSAVQAVLDHPTPNVAFDCPSPADDGTCPGHRNAPA